MDLENLDLEAKDKEMKPMLLEMLLQKVTRTRELVMVRTTLLLKFPAKLVYYFFFFWVPYLFWGFMYLFLNNLCFGSPICFGAFCF